MDITICDIHFGSLFFGQLKHEIYGEPRRISLDRLIENAGRYAVERSQVTVEHDLVTTDYQNRMFDPFGRDEGAMIWHAVSLRH